MSHRDSAPSSRRPNIVLILADDLGYSDLGCFGAEIPTPNLDALAASGARLTQLANEARCCPTRASLLTGLAPHEAGIGHMTADLGEPAYQGYLREEVVTLPEALRSAGYRTEMFGKWHLGGQWGTDPAAWLRQAGNPGYPRPVDRGFDHHFGTIAGAGSFFDPHTLIADTTFVRAPHPDFYYTDVIGEQAASAVDRCARGSDPFFLYIAHTAPHFPLHAPAEDVERFRGAYRRGWDEVRAERYDRALEAGVADSAWGLSPRDPHAPPWEDVEHQDWEDARMAVYTAQVHAMDRSVGVVLDAIRRNGIEEDTIVVFCSDNGGTAEFLGEEMFGAIDLVVPRTLDGKEVRLGNSPDIVPGPADTYMSYGLPWANVSNTPFRLFKSSIHEGGIATPFIVSWPGVVPAGGVLDAACSVRDLMPTFLDAAGADHPAEREGRPTAPPSGESLLPLWRGDLWRREAPVFWEHQGARGVRDGDWKLVSSFDWKANASGPWELYDMRADRTELHDRCTAEPERARELSVRWEDWARAVGVRPWADLLPILVARARGA